MHFKHTTIAHQIHLQVFTQLDYSAPIYATSNRHQRQWLWLHVENCIKSAQYVLQTIPIQSVRFVTCSSFFFSFLLVQQWRLDFLAFCPFHVVFFNESMFTALEQLTLAIFRRNQMHSAETCRHLSDWMAFIIFYDDVQLNQVHSLLRWRSIEYPLFSDTNGYVSSPINAMNRVFVIWLVESLHWNENPVLAASTDGLYTYFVFFSPSDCLVRWQFLDARWNHQKQFLLYFNNISKNLCFVGFHQF